MMKAFASCLVYGGVQDKFPNKVNVAYFLGLDYEGELTRIQLVSVSPVNGVFWRAVPTVAHASFHS